jgi:hypothetical protein
MLYSLEKYQENHFMNEVINEGLSSLFSARPRRSPGWNEGEAKTDFVTVVSRMTVRPTHSQAVVKHALHKPIRSGVAKGAAFK